MSLKEIRARLDKQRDEINDFTRWNSVYSYTPDEVEKLFKVLDGYKELLSEFVGYQDYEFPYRCPVLISRALNKLQESA